MKTALDQSLAEEYTSKSQQTRVVTETWAEENLYCLNCDSDRIEAHRPGKKVEDFLCPSCGRRIQLKAKRGTHGNKVASSAYQPTIEAIRNDEVPDYAFLSFDPSEWQVTHLFVVPGQFITPTVVEKREPLSSNAERSGWVGSNIRLDRIPEIGRIELVSGSQHSPRSVARREFEQAKFLSGRTVSTRGWTAAVMDCLDDLPIEPGDQFELADVYQFEDRLSRMYPENQHVRAKIRQQLQVLRDEGLVDFLGNGTYRLRWVDDRNRR
jgi:type II restriction enzyme